MDFNIFVVVLALFLTECHANTISVIEKHLGSCSFGLNDTCGYNFQIPWEIHEGFYLFFGRIKLLYGGQDDDFYTIFDPHNIHTNVPNPLYSMTSPLLPGGAACLSFYYTLPASYATLRVRIRTEDNVTKDLWNVTDRGIKNWTRVEGLVVEYNKPYMIEFVAKTATNAIVGVDNITIERFTCEPGYTPMQSEVRAYCTAALKTLPSCEYKDCAPFDSLHHGSVHIYNTTKGTMATFTCREGYLLNGSNIVECDSSGKWNNTGQYCELVECGPLSSPYHGEVSSSASVYGSIATVTCHTGYILHGNVTSMCSSNGTWTSDGQTCIPVDCGELFQPNNGIVTKTSTTYGSMATVKCHIGYNLNGSSISTCGSNGLWSSTMQQCLTVDCGPLKPPTRSWLSTGPSTYNSTVTITCFPGYKLFGSGTSMCGENGNWLNVDQECVLQTVFLKVPNANCTFEDNEMCSCENTSTVQQLNGSTTFDIRYLSGKGDFCNMVLWEVKSVALNTSLALTSSRLQPGVYLIRLRNVFSSKELQVTVETNANTSKILTHIERDQIWMNKTVVLTADIQFRIVFRANDTNETLLGLDNIQIFKACDMLNITNGIITVNHNTAYFDCNEGYRLVGNSSATCTQWTWSSEAPSCELLDCRRFTTPSNGNVLSTTTTYGSTVNITCHSGYILHGSKTSSCGRNGAWGSTGQTCEPVDCGRLTTPLYGSVATNATKYGSIATFECHAGYNLRGNSTSTCNSDGHWSSTGQQCELVDCGPFYPPKNSHLFTGSTTYNSTLTVSCFPGYMLSGNMTSTCASNGYWDNQKQECVIQTVFLNMPEASCTFADNGTCICKNTSPAQLGINGKPEMNDSLPSGDQGDFCFTVRWDNTSVQNNLSFTMISPILQPGLYQLSFQRLLPFGDVVITIETEKNETHVIESFWKYGQRDKLWLNETVMLIEEKDFRIVFRANDMTGVLLGLDNIRLLKACDLLNISNGHMTVDNNTMHFRCNEGYRLVGNSSAICTQWTWNSEAPSCELINCGRPIAPSNGHFTSNSTLYGSISTVSCSYGYFMRGMYMGVCGSDGKWSNENTTCLSINSIMSSAVNPGCSNQGWNIRVNRTLLRNSFPNYKHEIQIFLGIASCGGSEEYGFIIYDNSFKECMTNGKVSANLNIFENTIVLMFDPQNSAASTAFNWTMTVNCNVVDKDIVSKVSTNNLHSDVNSISLSVFSDPFFRKVLPSNPLHVHTGDKVYVKISSPIRDPEIKLSLRTCFVRPALEKDSRLDSVLIQNGCEVESSTHVISVTAHEIQFLYQNNAPASLREGMNIFCDVNYCNSRDLYVDCSQTCHGMLGPVIIG